MKKNSNIYTQISAGKYKGKKLLLPSLNTTRSTKSILKESLFNTLQFEIIDKVFVEVFGGSGSIGLEALSRGAKRAYFIEKDKSAYQRLQQNIDLIDRENSISYMGDSFEIYPQIAKQLSTQKEPCYLYFDPPFDIRDGMEGIYEKVISLIENTPSDIVIMIIVEHLSDRKMPDNIGSYREKKSKKFGKSTLTYYIKS
jgi:16S rRNA (guanine(966)-N(2))-methyltransferase RsmD